MNPSETRPFEGTRWMTISAVAGAAGLGLTLLGFTLDRRAASLSYLLAFAYWTGIAIAALIWLEAFHASGARWMVVLRRALETMCLGLPALAVLFAPIAFVLGDLYPWISPGDYGYSVEQLEVLHKKVSYLNAPDFLLRTAGYFVVLILIAELLSRWSRRQDTDADPALLVRMRGLASGGLPITGLVITFAAFDWLMSLEPLWYSTIFGLYYFAGSFLAAMCLLTLATTMSRTAGLYGELVSADHFHSLGKLVFAFTAFWAYIAYSQFMLVWIANLPDENFWFIQRFQTGWKPIGAAIFVGHFVLPFFVLLSRDLKQHPRLLSILSVWQLAMHFLDLYWVVNGGTGRSPVPHWTVFTALAGVGGVAVAVALFRARGLATLPVKDPFLADSLRYAP